MATTISQDWTGKLEPDLNRIIAQEAKYGLVLVDMKKDYSGNRLKRFQAGQLQVKYLLIISFLN